MPLDPEEEREIDRAIHSEGLPSPSLKDFMRPGSVEIGASDIMPKRETLKGFIEGKHPVRQLRIERVATGIKINGGEPVAWEDLADLKDAIDNMFK